MLSHLCPGERELVNLVISNNKEVLRERLKALYNLGDDGKNHEVDHSVRNNPDFDYHRGLNKYGYWMKVPLLKAIDQGKEDMAKMFLEAGTGRLGHFHNDLADGTKKDDSVQPATSTPVLKQKNTFER